MVDINELVLKLVAVVIHGLERARPPGRRKTQELLEKELIIGNQAHDYA